MIENTILRFAPDHRLGGSGTPENKPLFEQFERARDAYVELFASDKPLRELNYNHRQIELTKPVLKLMEGSGAITTKRLPRLRYRGMTGEEVEITFKHQNRQHIGFQLFANLTDEIDLLSAFMPDRGPIFRGDDGALALIYLLDSKAIDTHSIHSLAKIFHSPETGWTDKSLHPESVLSRIGRKVGLVSTYEASWIDDQQTKLAVRIQNPDEEPNIAAWKILSDKPMGFHSIGRMADYSNSMTRLIESSLEKESAVSGELVWQSF